MTENKTAERISAKKTVLLTVLALVSALLEAFFRSSVFGVVFTVFTAALVSSAVVFSGTFYPLLVGVGSYAISFALTLDPVASLASLEFLPVALVLAYSFKKKRTRLSMICGVSASLAIFELAILSISVYTTYGAFDAETLRSLLTGVHTALTDSIYDIFSAAAIENLAISYDTISSTVAYMFVLSPAVFITLYNVAAYLIQRTVIVIGRRVGARDMIYPEACIFKISRLAAFLYVASYLATVFFTVGRLSMLGAVTENLIIILTPGLALLGVKDFIRRRRERATTFPLFSILGMAFLLFTVPILFFGLAAFMGVGAAFRKN